MGILISNIVSFALIIGIYVLLSRLTTRLKKSHENMQDESGFKIPLGILITILNFLMPDRDKSIFFRAKKIAQLFLLTGLFAFLSWIFVDGVDGSHLAPQVVGAIGGFFIFLNIFGALFDAITFKGTRMKVGSENKLKRGSRTTHEDELASMTEKEGD